jgi:TrmH family RNA methyltransferase
VKYIASRENPVFQRALRIAQGKRDMSRPSREGRPALLEGVHLCQAWLQHMGLPETALFDAQRLESNTELRALASEVPEGVAVACEAKLMRALSQVEQGQGVFFIVHVPAAALPGRIAHNCLCLDRVQDPGNVGALLRTAAASGIRHAYLSAGCAAAWSGKALRSGQGAHFVMEIHEHVDLLDLRGRLDVPMLATSLERAQALYEAPLPARCAWFFGNEGQGLAAPLLQAADRRVFIPQDSAVESLNVVVAAGVCLFEQRRQHAQ